MRIAARALLEVAALAATLLIVPAAYAGREEPLPKGLLDVGITERLGTTVPGDLTFKDESGHSVRLGGYFDGRRPVILTLNYFECPMLCTLELNGLVDGLRKVAWEPGRDFQIVTVSFNPLETPTLARLKKQSYVASYDKPGAWAGWHFLTGSAEGIKALTDAVGFRYHYDERTGQFAHATAIMLTDGHGRLTRYLYGVEFEPKALRLALTEAGEGKVGTATDQILLYCFHYDANEGRYVVAATNLMRVGGALTASVVAGFLLVMWRREARRRRAASGDPPADGTPQGIG